MNALDSGGVQEGTEGMGYGGGELCLLEPFDWDAMGRDYRLASAGARWPGWGTASVRARALVGQQAP